MLGRLFGTLLLILSLTLAGGEAVMALGTGSYDALATGEVWTLLSGQPAPTLGAPSWYRDFMQLPAWTMAAALGLFLSVSNRKRIPKRRMLFRSLRSSSLH